MLKERKSRDVRMRSMIFDFHTNFVEDKIELLSTEGSFGGLFFIRSKQLSYYLWFLYYTH